MTPCWGLRGVSACYGPSVALDDVTWDLAPGAVRAVVGPDGAGKSTLLRVLVGLVPATSGAIDRPPPRQIGYVPARGGVFGELTVAENIAFVGSAHGLSHATLAQRRDVLLGRTGLGDAVDRRAADLSGGMARKLAFAMAVVADPALLVLDEPTTGVDPVSRAEIWGLLAATAADGKSVAMSTTYLDEAERAESVLVLDDGAGVLTGPPSSIVAAVPGALTWSDGCPRSGAAWRVGRRWKTWDPEAATGTGDVEASLEDAVIVAEIAGDGGASVHGSIPRPTQDRGGAKAGAGDVLRADRLVRRFGTYTAVDGFDLSIRAGEVVGLLGANGAGKTTTLRMLLGLLAPSAGSVAHFGAAPSRASRARIGYVAQGLGLWPTLTVAENIGFVEGAYGADPEAARAAVSGVPDRPVGLLPLGQQRRVGFAAAFGHTPDVLVLDEPTSGVSPLARAHLWDAIHEAADAGMAVIVTTHYMDEAAHCGRLVVMAAGRTVAEGPMESIVDDAKAVLVGTEDWAAAFAALKAAGLPVSIVGTACRILGVDPATVEAVLDRARVTADVGLVPATFDEVFVALSRAPAGAA